MTAQQFRALVLELPEATEGAQMKHPDFRLADRVIASLGYPDENFAMVRLSLEQQAAFMRTAPRVFSPCAGAWGEGGATSVLLAKARAPVIRLALRAAAQHARGQSAP